MEQTMINYIIQNWHDIVGIAGAVVIGARLVVKLTPTPKDDSILDRVVGVLKQLGLHLD